MGAVYGVVAPVNDITIQTIQTEASQNAKLTKKNNKVNIRYESGLAI